jgi:hypothetical protein
MLMLPEDGHCADGGEKLVQCLQRSPRLKKLTFLQFWVSDVSKAVSLFDKLKGLQSLQEVELINACIGVGVSETLCLASNCSRAEDEVIDAVARHTAQLPADLRSWIKWAHTHRGTNAEEDTG